MGMCHVCLAEAASMLGSPLESPGYDAILAACSRGRAWQAVRGTEDVREVVTETLSFACLA